MTNLERRTMQGDAWEIREDDQGRPHIVGYAARYNVPSEVMGDFVEVLLPSAFDAVLGNDVRALFNHDPNMILARSSAGTLTVTSDSVGLLVDIDPPDTTYARDLMTSIRRGDVTGQSFAFVVADGGAKWSKRDDGLWTRTIGEIAELWDVGPVVYPAYASTDVSVALRSLDGLRKENPPVSGHSHRMRALDIRHQWNKQKKETRR